MPTRLHALPGPKTQEGKARVSQNATKHGLTAKTIVLANESQAAFQSLLESLTVEWCPAGDTEFLLVEEMAAAAWRQRRAWSIESAHFDLAMVQNEPAIQEQFNKIDHAARTAIAHKSLIEQGRALANIQRHEERLSRQHDRALRRLQELQRQRRQREASEKPLENNSMQNNPPAIIEKHVDQASPCELLPANAIKENSECTGPSNHPPNLSLAKESS
ncbi:MAG: hypothetical protein R2762_29660 [Bryobacteraceae bacterium]